jgi:hypothetical protein
LFLNCTANSFFNENFPIILYCLTSIWRWPCKVVREAVVQANPIAMPAIK